MKQGNTSINTIFVTQVRKSQLPNITPVKTYFQEIKPLLQLLRALGRLPYSFNNEGLSPFKIISFPVLYTTIFFVVQLVWSFYSFCFLFQEEISRSGSYDQTLFWVGIALTLTLNINIPFTYWHEAPKIAKYVIMWKNFQEENKNLDFKLCMSLSVKVFTVLIIPLVVGGMTVEKYLLTDLTMLVFIPYLSAVCSSGITIMMWFTSLHELRSISRQFLSKIILNGCRDMSSHRRTWLSLSRLVSGTGDTHGHTGIAICSVLFCSFVLSMYALLGFLIEYKGTSSVFWGLFVRSLISAAATFVFCDIAHTATKEVGSDFSSKILTIDVSHLKDSELAEVSLLLQAMSANPPVLDFVGFVKINRHLFVSFISNSVTYLIVLIQFRATAQSTSTGHNATIRSQ